MEAVKSQDVPTRKGNIIRKDNITPFPRKADRKAQKSQPDGVIPFSGIQVHWHQCSRE